MQFFLNLIVLLVLFTIISGNCLFLLNFATVLITINPGSDETYPDSKVEISTKLVALKLGLFFFILQGIHLQSEVLVLHLLHNEL